MKDHKIAFGLVAMLAAPAASANVVTNWDEIAVKAIQLGPIPTVQYVIANVMQPLN
jgi:hypothetical protein